MPHSPYIQQVDPPISDNDIVTFRHDLQRIRWERDDGIDDKFAIDTTLHSGELLLEQCEFLEAKLTIKVCNPTPTPKQLLLRRALSTAADMASIIA